MKKETYMIIDLAFMAVIMWVLEFAAFKAKGFFPGEVYTVSIVMPVFLISIMRWGLWGFIHAILGGLAYAYIYSGSYESMIIYTLGGLGAIFSYAVIKIFGKERIRKSPGLTFIYCIAAWLGLACFRTIAAVIITKEGLELFTRFLFTDTLSAIIAVMAIFIARAQNGLFEDQLSYLLRLQKEEKMNGS